MNSLITDTIDRIFGLNNVIFCYETACELNDLSDIYGNKFYFYHSEKRLKSISLTSETRWSTSSRFIPIYRETLENISTISRYGFRCLTVEGVLKEMLEQKYDYFMQMTYECFNYLWELKHENWDFILKLCDTPDKLKFFNEIREDCEEYYDD
jgi:hypothetical protein